MTVGGQFSVIVYRSHYNVHKQGDGAIETHSELSAYIVWPTRFHSLVLFTFSSAFGGIPDS